MNLHRNAKFAKVFSRKRNQLYVITCLFKSRFSTITRVLPIVLFITSQLLATWLKDGILIEKLLKSWLRSLSLVIG